MSSVHPTQRDWRDNERGGIAVMVGIFALLMATTTWALLAAVQRHSVDRHLHHVADSLALAGAAMVLEQGVEGDVVRNWDSLVATVGRPNASGQPFTARARVIYVKDEKRERRLVEVTVESDLDSVLGRRHYRIVSYAYVSERLYTDEWPVLVLVLDASNSMGATRYDSKFNKKTSLWKKLQNVVDAFLNLQMPVRTGVVAFNDDVAATVAPAASKVTFYEGATEKVPASMSDADICVKDTTADPSAAGAQQAGGAAPAASGKGKSKTAMRELRSLTCASNRQAIRSALRWLKVFFMPFDKRKGSTNIKAGLDGAREMLAAPAFFEASKRAVTVSDGEPSAGGSMWWWVPFLGKPTDKEAAFTAGKKLRETKKNGVGLFSIETAARHEGKSKFLIELSGPPLVAGEPDTGNPSCGDEQKVQYPFYMRVAQMDDVDTILIQLAKAICSYGPLKMSEGDPIAVYLETPQGDTKLKEGTDYELCSGWVQLSKERCRTLGQNSDQHLVIRWGRPRLTSGPDGP